MRIGQLEKETSIPVETLRFWERQGLLSPSRKGPGKYRNYSESDVKLIKFILNAKSVGFTLSEISQLIEMQSSEKEGIHDEILAFAKNKLTAIESKLLELKSMRQNLAKIIQDCSDGATANAFSMLQSMDDDVG